MNQSQIMGHEMTTAPRVFRLADGTLYTVKDREYRVRRSGRSVDLFVGCDEGRRLYQAESVGLAVLALERVTIAVDECFEVIDARTDRERRDAKRACEQSAA